MSVISAKYKGVAVEFDELVADSVIKMREATFDALSAGGDKLASDYKDACATIAGLHKTLDSVTADSAQFKKQRDENWNALQEAKAKLEINAAGKESKK